jgi:hypothetical protein
MDHDGIKVRGYETGMLNTCLCRKYYDRSIIQGYRK